jgi:hypothetical protein
MRIIMQLKISTAFIYLLASATTYGYMGSQRTSDTFSPWLAISFVPLLFAFAYPRSLFASPPERTRYKLAVTLNVLCASAATFLFTHLALPYPGNPLGNVDSLNPLIVPLIALSVTLVAAFSIFFKKTSGLAGFACVFVWIYYCCVALMTVDRFFYEHPLHRAFYFLCFVSPVLFAFAAGATPYRSTFAHGVAAFAGVSTLPWIYWTEVRNWELSNPWIMFNVPTKDERFYPLLHVKLTILCVALVLLATATALLRLLPPQWELRKKPLSERTWPAYAASLFALAVWFGQSVVPYRIPGALDYAQFPVLQILHVEKRGLQFRESSMRVFPSYSVSFSGNDRRLLQYRFQQKYASGQLTQALTQRVFAILQSPNFAKREPTAVKPLRAWNAEGWYFYAANSGIFSNTTENGTAPPKEIVALFRDIEAAPRSAETQSELKDVCLGFCYDPLSAMGYLYSNHRCFNDGHGTRCR